MNLQGEQLKTVLVQGFAVVGFIAVLFMGLWGTVQVVKLAPHALSNLASVTSFTSIFVPNEKITINTPSSVIQTDTVFELTWEHKGKLENGTYTFNYACRNGLSFQISNDNGVYEEIQCDTPFSFISNTNSITLIPLSKENQFIEVPIVITSINESGESTTLDDSFLTIANEMISGDSLLSSNLNLGTSLVAGDRVEEVYPISDSRSVSNSNGQVDLATHIISTGVVDAHGEFTSTSSIGIHEEGAIRFSVTNIGSKTSDNWTFNAVLPTYPMHIFHSTNQKALAPGDRIDFTLGFNQLNGNLTDGVITINVDPSGSISNEFNRDNNIAQVTIKITK